MDQISAMRELDYGITVAVQALVEAMGMAAENTRRQHLGASVAYTDADFLEVINRLGVNHNAVLTRWQKIS